MRQAGVGIKAVRRRAPLRRFAGTENGESPGGWAGAFVSLEQERWRQCALEWLPASRGVVLERPPTMKRDR